jgi:hypothetical protein
MKKFYESKTVWLGILMLTASILSFLQGEELIKEYPILVSVLGTVAGILTIVIRYFTEAPMRLTQEFKAARRLKNG